MRVLLTSAGLETQDIKSYFVKMIGKEMSLVKALFIPTAAINVGAIEVLPKCINDLLKCGIPEKNIQIFDLHVGMGLNELKQYDVVYICGGDPYYLLERINETGFGKSLMEYIERNGIVLGVSAGSLIFCNNLAGNLGLLDINLEVHCTEGERKGKMDLPLKNKIRLTNARALAIRNSFYQIEII